MTVTTTNHTALSLPDTELLAPATIEPLFWRPRFLVETPALDHVPFLFWLCNVLRPRSVGVLGAGNGVVHFALCQALDKLNIAGRCTSYGFWPDCNTVHVPAHLTAHEVQIYDHLSTLTHEASPAAAMEKIAPASLDLLAVDLAELGDHDVQPRDWLARLKPGGVLILHATNGLPQDRAKALAHHLHDNPQAGFRAGKGLVMLTQGSSLPHRLQTLLDICENGVVPADIDRIFRRLGQGLSLLAAKEQSDARLNAMRQARDAEKALRAESDKQLAELRQAYEQRNHKLADLQSRFFDAEQALAQERFSREQEKHAPAAELEALRREHEREFAAAQQAHSQEMATLTRRIEDMQPLYARQTDEIRALQKELARLRAANAKKDRHINDLLNSTSWRITAPMRKVGKAIKR